MARTDLLWRATVVAAGAVLTVVGVPHPVPGVVCVVAAVLAGERLVRSREQGLLEALVGLVGGALVLLVLLGLPLGTTGLGLRPGTWALGLTVVSAAMLVLAARLPRPAPLPRDRRVTGLLLRTAPWVVASTAVAVLAVTVSVQSLHRTDRDPLQMSLASTDRVEVAVRIQATSDTGPLELRTTHERNEVSYPLFSLRAGQSVTRTVLVPKHGRYHITLNRPSQSQPLRSLVLDR